MSDTEGLNQRYVDIDRWPTIDAIEAMLEGQMAAVASIRGTTARIAAAADAAANRLSAAGRLVYVGAGTSGRVAVQDGVELRPTFGWPENRLAYLIAGGMDALAQSAEGAEDDAITARAEIKALALTPDDVVIGVAASGKTPYTIAAIQAARTYGALTISLANNPGTGLLEVAEHALIAETGSELIAGSTRMKAGTAQKVILNLLSTAIMLRLGRVYRGLMVDMVISNDKLFRRALGIVQTITGCTAETANTSLGLGNRDIKKAILIAMGQSPAAATSLLDHHRGILQFAIEALGESRI